MTQKELDPDFLAFNSENRRYHFPARFYLPFRSSFAQVDPLILFEDGSVTLRSGSLEGYSYAKSNPLMYVDPLGLKYEYRGGKIIGAKPDPQITSRCVRAGKLDWLTLTPGQCFNECCCDFSFKATCSGTWGTWVAGSLKNILDHYFGPTRQKPVQFFATLIFLKYHRCTIPPKGSAPGGRGENSRCWDDNHCIGWCKGLQLGVLADLNAMSLQNCGELRSLPEFDGEIGIGGTPMAGGNPVTAWPGYDEGKPMPPGWGKR